MKSATPKTPHIVVFSTGGTILSKMDAGSGVVKPALTGKELLNTMDSVYSRFKIETIELLNMPGSDLTLREGLLISKEIQKAQNREEVDGIVVLQGTDTMDEIPYFVDLTVSTHKPVVFTGAMKSMHDVYSDASGNVLGAAMVAACSESANKGVLVFFNETIFAASELIKAHASRIDAFESVFGPLGSISKDQVHYVRSLPTTKVYDVSHVDIDIPLFKVHTSLDNRLIEYAVTQGAHGLVVEGYGSGNVPRTMVPTLEKILEKNIPIVVATRCIRGESYACYGYVGGGAQLEPLGIILAGALSGIKSRIKLVVLLASACSIDEIRTAFATNQ